jgi:hypothetical protein
MFAFRYLLTPAGVATVLVPAGCLSEPRQRDKRYAIERWSKRKTL